MSVRQSHGGPLADDRSCRERRAHVRLHERGRLGLHPLWLSRVRASGHRREEPVDDCRADSGLHVDRDAGVWRPRLVHHGVPGPDGVRHSHLPHVYGVGSNAAKRLSLSDGHRHRRDHPGLRRHHHTSPVRPAERRARNGNAAFTVKTHSAPDGLPKGESCGECGRRSLRPEKVRAAIAEARKRPGIARGRSP